MSWAHWTLLVFGFAAVAYNSTLHTFLVSYYTALVGWYSNSSSDVSDLVRTLHITYGLREFSGLYTRYVVQ